MAYELPLFKLAGLRAAADLSACQYHFVTITDEGVVNVCDAITDVPIGVLQNKPDEGEAAEVVAIGVTKLVTEENLSAGQLVSTNANGHAILCEPGSDTTVYIAGIALADSTSGETASILINLGAPARAL
jgi:hypothetical protein